MTLETQNGHPTGTSPADSGDSSLTASQWSPRSEGGVRAAIYGTPVLVGHP